MRRASLTCYVRGRAELLARLSSRTLPFSSSAITRAGTSNREDQEIHPQKRVEQGGAVQLFKKRRLVKNVVIDWATLTLLYPIE